MTHNLLKNLMLALLMTVAVPFMKAQEAHVGDILCEGDLIVSPASFDSTTQVAVGVVFYVDNTGLHGWAISLADVSDHINFASYGDLSLGNYEDVRSAIYDLDGYHNTQVVRETGGGGIFNAVDFANGWYVPAIGQLNYLYGNLLEVNASLEVAGGTPFEMNGTWNYWSSTEYGHYYAWDLENTGEIKDNYKANYYLLRAARNF